MIRRDRYRELGTVRRFASTDKELPMHVNEREEAYWHLAGRVEDRFGSEGGTASDIYHEVTGPLGLSAETTMELLKLAKSGGYLR